MARTAEMRIRLPAVLGLVCAGRQFRKHALLLPTSGRFHAHVIVFGKVEEPALGTLSDAAYCTLRAVKLLGNFLRGEPHEDSFHDRPIVDMLLCPTTPGLSSVRQAASKGPGCAVNERPSCGSCLGQGHLVP